MKKDKQDKRSDIIFTTPRGMSVKLTFDKEYRAFRQCGSVWIPMSLGGSDSEALKAYIIKNF